jgi:SanA protein
LKKYIFWGMISFGGGLIILVILPLLWIKFSSLNDIFTSQSVPNQDVAIVFGAAIYEHYPSDVYADRLQTAAELYHSRKVKKILVSGDNSRAGYNEPTVGKDFLIRLRVPEYDIVLDYAGFRTFDTCARARRVFQVQSAALVSQSFHIPRTVFLCQSFGIDAVGVVAKKHLYSGHVKNIFRETLARYIAFWEATLFRHDPKFLGEALPIFSH